jgi:hypothetical protein
LAKDPFFEWILQIPIPAKPFGDSRRAAGGTRRAVERGKIAMEGLVSLEAIREVGKGSAERLRGSPGQTEMRSVQEQRVYATAQRATPCLNRFPHKPGALTEKVHN